MEQFLERRREATAAAWDFTTASCSVAAGDEIPVPGRGDRTYPFRAHSEYLYLTDRERPGGVLAFDPGDGWVEFVVPVTARGAALDRARGRPRGRARRARGPLDELEAFVAGRPVRRLGATAEPTSSCATR